MQGDAGISLRAIARNIGVTATALYRHFPDKASLLAALAQDGFACLADTQKQALAHGQGFAGLGRAYVRFALANPHLFRLMFARLPANAHPDQESPDGSAAWLLRTGVAKILGEDAPKRRQFAAMLRAWSLVHGLAMLILDRQVDRKTAEAMIDEIVSETSIGFG